MEGPTLGLLAPNVPKGMDPIVYNFGKRCNEDIEVDAAQLPCCHCATTSAGARLRK
jgi:hypothetical protein